MAQELSKSSIRQAKQEFARISSFLDGGVVVARRFTELLSEIEPAVLRLFLLFHLIFDLVALGALLIRTIAH
jgi:hypothetical protein